MNDLLTEAFVIGLLAATLRIAAPLALAAMGELFSERSGVLNLGLEGMMLMGAFVGFWATWGTGNIFLGALAACFVGGLLALLMAFLTVDLKFDQVLASLGVFFVGSGMSGFFKRLLTNSETDAILRPLPAIFTEKIQAIPWIGPIFLSHNILFYITVVILIIGFIVFKYSSVGLKIKAVGENPRAADTIGVNVRAIRYGCVTIAGLLGGLTGMMISVGTLGVFREEMTLGRGFIAIAIVAFGRWNPTRTLIGALIFGGAYALQLRLQTFSMPIPNEVLLMLPYILTIAIMMIGAKGLSSPKALGTNYSREER
jgi:ABC-type uncharacterized transport system permease subunit